MALTCPWVPEHIPLSLTPPADLIGGSISHEERHGTQVAWWTAALPAALGLTDCDPTQGGDRR